MFGNLKKKLTNAIQEGIVISESLQQNIRQRVSQPSTPASSPTVDDRSYPSSITTNTSSSSRNSLSDLCISDVEIPSELNMAAGCKILAKYEDDWKAIRDANEENTAKAEQVARQIEVIGQSATMQRVVMSDLIICLSGIPALVAKLNESNEKLEELRTLSASVETELVKLEDLCEEYDLQEYISQKQFELNQFKHRKMAELESYRQKVAAEHQAKIRDHEERLRQIQRERQAVFDDAFRNDLEEYKRRGSIPKIQQGQHHKELTLEEVSLEDTNTKDALEEFLNG